MKKQFFATLLALLILVSVMPTTASATTSYNLPVTIVVDGGTIPGTNAYLDINGDVRLPYADELFRVFPRELKEVVVAYNPDEGILIRKYIDDFGYDWELRDNILYIYTTKSHSQIADVFVNGVYVPTNNQVYVTPQGNAFFYSSTLVSTIFPKEATLDSSYLDAIGLDFFAKRFGYSMTCTADRVYLNNDGNTPVEVLLNGQRVNFPDQQPIIIDGRTLVPVRAIAELLNCKVDWDNANRLAVITKGGSQVLIHPDYNIYVMDGTVYPLDVPAKIINSRTMVPLRFLAEAFGYQVGFYHNSGVAVVTLDS